MNKLSTKLLTAALCVVLCFDGAASVVFASNSTDHKEERISPDHAEAAADEAVKLSKDETVYVLAGADGKVNKIIVSDWIKNALSSESISDQTDLTDIENIKGNESYTLNNDNMTIWNAEGNDIYYQGTMEKELPVGLSVSYKLDGSSISAGELIGKSGKVTIRFDYDNRQYEMVEIDGKQEKIYVPYVMLTGMLLDSDTFSNVEVSNGKLLNDGERTAVIGFAMPGLQDNLGITKDKIDIPDYVEITADVTDFELGMTVTIAANELFSNLNDHKLDSTDELVDSARELTDGMQQLLDGSSELYSGLTALFDKTEELAGGINELADGAGSLKEGAASLSEGAAQLSSGTEELSGGLGTLVSNNDTLNAGAKQVFETLLSNAAAQINAAGIPVPELTIDNYASVLEGMIDSIGETSEAAEPILSLKDSLDSYNAFYLGLLGYTDGVAAAANGAVSLAAGANALNDGAVQLQEGTTAVSDGLLQLKNAVPALNEGVSQLKDGAMHLNAGLEKFNEEGIQRIVNLVESDLNGIVSRLKATIDVSKKYYNFSGISEEMDGQVKFIYRTEEINVDKTADSGI